MNVMPKRAVRDRTIEADLVTLLTALNWACRERDRQGRRLLRENPLFGVALPREKNPRRPVMSHDTFASLLAKAATVSPLLKLGLVVAEGTGRRASAWLAMRWDDVNFEIRDEAPFGSITWRAENDKRGYEQTVPMPEAVREALREWRQQLPAIGTAWVFPSPRDAIQHCSRHVLDDWLRRAYKLAEIEPEHGGLWHPLRRKWATERKNYPVKDVAAAGGWRDVQTVLRSYQHADAATVREVVLTPTLRLAKGGG